MENCLFISKSIDFNLPSIFNWFTFTKKYGTEAMINNTISSLNNIQKTISSNVLCDTS